MNILDLIFYRTLFYDFFANEPPELSTHDFNVKNWLKMPLKALMLSKLCLPLLLYFQAFA